jgi:hypothetical protein
MEAPREPTDLIETGAATAAGDAVGWQRFAPDLLVALVVVAIQLATFSVDVLGGSEAPHAIRWSAGLPMRAVAWAYVEAGTVIPLDEGMKSSRSALVDIPWLGIDVLRSGTSWSPGLHIDVPGFAIDGIVACILYLLLRRILRGDGPYAARALVLGVGAGAVMESLSRSVLTIQGESSWFEFAACVLLVPPAIALLARGAIRGWSTRLVMSIIAAWLVVAVLRFSDPLLRRRIWSDIWNKPDNLVGVLVVSLGWWLLASAWAWWLRRGRSRAA